MSKSTVTTTATPARPHKSVFGKAVVIILLLILLIGCLGTLGLCYFVTRNGIDVRVDDGKTATTAPAATTTASPDFFDAICVPFGNFFKEIFQIK